MNNPPAITPNFPTFVEALDAATTIIYWHDKYLKLHEENTALKSENRYLDECLKQRGDEKQWSTLQEENARLREKLGKAENCIERGCIKRRLLEEELLESRKRHIEIHTENTRLHTALGFYADESNWAIDVNHCKTDYDEGHIAREALSLTATEKETKK